MQEKTAGEHIGALLWVGRGTRPDVLTAVTRLASRLTKWSAYEDRLLGGMGGMGGRAQTPLSGWDDMARGQTPLGGGRPVVAAVTPPHMST